jgi:uncharacterized protein (TIGR03084 family)
MMTQAQDFWDESEALFALISDLSDAELETPTLFKSWTMSDIIGHLHMWNWAADLTLQDGERFKAFLGEVLPYLSGGGKLTTFEKTWRNGLGGRDLVAAWRSFCAPMAQRFGAADPKARVAWAGPDMSVRSCITARLMETWAHAQAIYDLMGVTRQDGERIRNIATLGVNTYGWTFACRKQPVPEPMPCVHLRSPSGEIWTYGDESTDERISGSATAFCQVVTQVRNIADVDLVVRGKNARVWMANAQCFAGPPEQPPAPGSRFKAATPFGSTTKK